jgi:hypothetical protein
MTPVELAAALKSKDDKARAAAIEAAAQCGAAAIQTVCPLLGDAETETQRAAKRALYQIVHDAGKPGAAAAAKAAEKEFVAVLQASISVPERREVLWMLSEIGGDDSVKPIAALLGNADLREDARCVLQRLPLKAAVKALESALKTVPEEFRFALAESLRKRGEKVSGYPSKRLVPTKQTSVQPAA